MKCFVLCVIVSCGIAGGHASPQGLFGGFLPSAKPQEGASPPKGPLAIFTQGQQQAQAVVGGFVAGLADARDKIRNETKKRIQSLLGNKNKVDVPTSEKPEETVDPNKEDVETLPEKIQEPSPNTETEDLDKKPEVTPEPDVDEKIKPNSSSDKVKSENKDKIKPQEKQETPKKSTPKTPAKESTTVDSAELDKLLEDVFATSSPSEGSS